MAAPTLEARAHSGPSYTTLLDSTDLAGRIGDGYIAMQPDASMIQRFEAAGGAGKPKQGGLKACFAADADDAVRTVHHYWPNEGVPGELSQVLRTPEHIMQASSLVTPEQLASSVVCGPDAGEHADAVRAYTQAGFDEVYVNQIGPDQDDFFHFYGKEVLPELRR